MDTFTCFVSHVADHGSMADDPKVTKVIVSAPTTNEATLTAIEMVAARGRTPVAVEVDWDNF